MECLKCGKEFEQKSKIHKYCSKVCGNQSRQHKYYETHADKMRETRLKNNSYVDKYILTRVKSRCKAKGIPFNLELSDIVVPEYCPVLGIRLQYNPGCGRNPVASPSVDRINPELGYTKGNIRVISNRANLLKSNATVEELELVLKDVRRIQHGRV